MSTNALRVTFRADASPRIGGGHVSRCLTLASALRQHGFVPQFVTVKESAETVPALAESGFHQHVVEAGDFTPQGGVVDVVVFDHYEIERTAERLWRKVAGKQIVIDDIADRAHDADALIDQTCGRDAGDYAALVPPTCKVLAGSFYALLRDEFAAAREGALMRRRARPGRSLLISLGATDRERVTETVLAALNGVPLDHVDVVVGAGYPDIPALRTLAGSIGSHVTVHIDARNVAELMAKADLSVGAPGTTSWERCSVGLPAILIVTADNQNFVAQQLVAHGAAVGLGHYAEITAKQIGEIVRELISDGARLETMASAAASLCDGRGADRVAAVVADLAGLAKPASVATV